MVVGGGDYVVRGDSSYMAETSPRWADKEEGGGKERLGRGVLSNMRYNSEGQGATQVRRLSRVVSVHDSQAPQLHVRMSSCSQCPSCRRLLYDEEIMANWSNSDADYKTTCPYCHSRLVASLTITMKQTLPCSESSMKQQQGDNMVIIEEEREEADGPLSLHTKSKTWDSREASRMKKTNTVDYSYQSEIKSWATPTQNSIVGEGRGSPSPTGLDTLDGAKLEYPPGLLYSPPRTDPIHRRLGNQMRGKDSPGRTRAAQTNRRAVKRSGNEDLNEAESPLPTVLNAKGSTQASKPASNADSSTPSQEKPSSTDIVVSEIHRGDSIAAEEVANPLPNSQITRSLTTAAEPSHGGKDEPDVGVNKYIAQMRARGHKRSSSAPISYQPPPPSPSPDPQTQGEGVGKTVKGREEIARYCTESSPPLVVPYLSPVVLRKEMESFIIQEGGKGLEKEELVRDRPIMYWNLVWYFSRLQLPTYLPLLILWSFTRRNQELRKHYVQMKVDLLWDSRFPYVRDPLYLLWLGKVPKAMQVPPNPQSTRRDSESQLQSLVARTQCGDLLPVLNSLLEDRKQKRVGQEGVELASRSVYRETLFLKSVLADGYIDIDLFEREYLQNVQRLPRELSSFLRHDDHLPSPRTLQCRRDFGCLHVS